MKRSALCSDRRTQHRMPNAPSSAGHWLGLGDNSRAKSCCAGVGSLDLDFCVCANFSSCHPPSGSVYGQMGSSTPVMVTRSAWKDNSPSACHRAAALDALLKAEVLLRTGDPCQAAEPQAHPGKTPAVPAPTRAVQVLSGAAAGPSPGSSPRRRVTLISWCRPARAAGLLSVLLPYHQQWVKTSQHVPCPVGPIPASPARVQWAAAAPQSQAAIL